MSEESIRAALDAHADNGGSSTEMNSLGNDVVTDVIDPVVDGAGADGVVAVTDGVVEGADPAVTPEPKVVEQDEIDKLLAKEGIQATSTRGENRIPYSRTKSILKNAQTEWTTQHVAPLQTQVTQLTQANQSYRNAEQLASSDPDRYIAGLAAVDPRYQKFLSPQPVTPAVAAKDDDPEPQAEKDPATGQTFYSESKWAEHQAWSRRQAEKGALAAMEKKYGPVLTKQLQLEASRAAYEERRPGVERQVKAVNDTFGAKLVADHEAPILKIMQDGEAAGYHVSFAEAAAQVLMPILRADEARIREKVVADLNKRPAAAARTVGQSVRGTGVAGDGEAALSGTDLIKRELDRALPGRAR